tara:strand:+ start:16 stop:156 length:141 start_codon:yes stop_codon:yes gene_type:complete
MQVLSLDINAQANTLCEWLLLAGISMTPSILLAGLIISLKTKFVTH